MLNEVEKIRAEIELLVKKMQEAAGRRNYAELDIGGVKLEWDGYEWSPAASNHWYSSSMEC